MRKRKIKLLNNKYIIAHHVKINKKQRYFRKRKLYDSIFYQLLIKVVLTC
jgi:hypothetical protein